MKKLLLSAVALLTIGSAQAQFRYSLTTQTGQTYTPLTTGTDLTNGAFSWDSEDYTTPLTFPFVLNGQPTSDFILLMGNDGTFIATSSSIFDPLHAFIPLESDLVSRNGTGAASGSPIRYLVTGSAGSRIFKAEVVNAGFWDDNNNGADFVNFQIWMYEGTNVVELRYGPSSLHATSYADYFPYGHTGPVVGLANGVNSLTQQGKIYNLAGSPSAPTRDSLEYDVLPNGTDNTLAGFPANGTVYRFTPTGATGTSIGEAPAATAGALKLYPTAATTVITVEWSGADGEAYQILSATGQRVAAGQLQRGTQSIPVNALAAGVYHLRLAAGTHQFVKQ